MLVLLLGGNGNGSGRVGLEILNKLYAYDVPNYVFRNSGDLTFTDMSSQWGIERPAFSYGAAYADLDNNGRLDLVVSNINAPAFIYQNVGSVDDAHHYLAIRLEGESPRQPAGGIGSKLTLTAGGLKQHIEYTPYRGYMSTVDGRVHFGLGPAGRVDSLEVVWPDGRYQVLRNLEADRLLVVKQADATVKKPPACSAAPRNQRFAPIDAR